MKAYKVILGNGFFEDVSLMIYASTEEKALLKAQNELHYLKREEKHTYKGYSVKKAYRIR